MDTSPNLGKLILGGRRSKPGLLLSLSSGLFQLCGLVMPEASFVWSQEAIVTAAS
jgi:hypothetical protein